MPDKLKVEDPDSTQTPFFGSQVKDQDPTQASLFGLLSKQKPPVMTTDTGILGSLSKYLTTPAPPAESQVALPLQATTEGAMPAESQVVFPLQATNTKDAAAAPPLFGDPNPNASAPIFPPVPPVTKSKDENVPEGGKSKKKKGGKSNKKKFSKKRKGGKRTKSQKKRR